MVGELLLLSGGTGPIPKPKSRAEIISILDHFQGLVIHSKTYGDLPWFTAGLTALDAVGELDAVVDQLQAAGDTHTAVDLLFNYGEPNQPWGSPQAVPDRDLRGDFATYASICDKVIRRGQIPVYVLPTEGLDGLAWLYANLQGWVSAMRVGYDRLAYGIIQLGYDGTWPATWSVQDMKTVLPFCRGIIGDGAYLSMMFANGPAGAPYPFVEDEGDYAKAWMQCLDVVQFSTQPDQAVCPALVNNCTRMVGPALRPSGICTPEGGPGPFLLAPGTPRGPYGFCFREWREYQFVRDASLAPAIEAQRAQMTSLGIASHG